jgi:hypothetical protein
MPVTPPWMRIGRLLPRGRWDQEGVLATDDFSMPAVPGA